MSVKRKLAKLKRFLSNLLALALACVAFGYLGWRCYRDLRGETGVSSYAYVTGVEAHRAVDGNGHNQCEIDALLPPGRLEHPPDGERARRLLRGATDFYELVHDPHNKCRGYLHTWKRVVFDPDDRSGARFAFAVHESHSEAILLVVVIGLAIVVSLVRRIFRAPQLPDVPPTG